MTVPHLNPGLIQGGQSKLIIITGKERNMKIDNHLKILKTLVPQISDDKNLVQEEGFRLRRIKTKQLEVLSHLYRGPEQILVLDKAPDVKPLNQTLKNVTLNKTGGGDGTMKEVSNLEGSPLRTDFLDCSGLRKELEEPDFKKLKLSTCAVTVDEFQPLPSLDGKHCDILDPSLISEESQAENPDMVLARIAVSAEWNDPIEILQSPSLEASTKFEMDPGWLDPRSPLLSGYDGIEALLQFNQVLDAESTAWSSDSLPAISVAKELDIILNESKNAMYLDANSKPILGGAFFRKDLDFTEKLWEILRHCTDNKELVSSLTKVFQALKMKTISPMVHKTNGSSLARHIRDTYRDELLVPRLDGLLPVQILVEIGVEKMRRDYVFAIGISDIGSDVMASKEAHSLTTTSAPLSQQVLAVKHLHKTLETILLGKTLLELSATLLRKLAKLCLDGFNPKAIHDSFSVEMSVRSSDVGSMFDRCKPQRWSAFHWLEESSGAEFSHSILVSKNPIVSYVTFSPKQEEMAEEAKNWDDAYYAATLIQSTLIVG